MLLAFETIGIKGNTTGSPHIPTVPPAFEVDLTCAWLGTGLANPESFESMINFMGRGKATGTD
jgi:hypothetical protein